MSGVAPDLAIQIGELRGSMVGLREALSDVKSELYIQRQARHDMANAVQGAIARGEKNGDRIDDLEDQVKTMQGNVSPLIDLKRNAAGALFAASAFGSALLYLLGPDLRLAMTHFFGH